MTDTLAKEIGTRL